MVNKLYKAQTKVVKETPICRRYWFHGMSLKYLSIAERIVEQINCVRFKLVSLSLRYIHFSDIKPILNYTIE